MKVFIIIICHLLHPIWSLVTVIGLILRCAPTASSSSSASSTSSLSTHFHAASGGLPFHPKACQQKHPIGGQLLCMVSQGNASLQNMSAKASNRRPAAKYGQLMKSKLTKHVSKSDHHEARCHMYMVSQWKASLQNMSAKLPKHLIGDQLPYMISQWKASLQTVIPQ